VPHWKKLTKREHDVRTNTILNRNLMGFVDSIYILDLIQDSIILLDTIKDHYWILKIIIKKNQNPSISKKYIIGQNIKYINDVININKCYYIYGKT
jgi:hypothetical protein